MKGSDIIVIDFETTGLVAPIPANIDKQPYATEMYAVRLTKDFDFVEEFETMVKPPIPISEEITKITGITQADVDSAPSFIQIYDQVYDLFEGVNHISGHNIMFDITVLRHELFRHDFEWSFHFPKHKYCTVELSRHFFNKRLRLQQLHEHLFGFPFEGAHRAKTDVSATTKCLIELFKRGDANWKK